MESCIGGRLAEGNEFGLKWQKRALDGARNILN
jgi:hypothetical protein